ncbi:Transposase DDE domain-containing protein [Nitrosomonas sp. Nm51]|uniref:transposase n=1 Tax=Nitrosomonas sp. Nm51 TaxID=133720 RepID=UPI0008B1F91B|nr:transposase [Nitrosomonas sp. Nm51]SER71914.1 Transposase DDE domain-containing protein [Nitrosomonas sp. Nm51]
MESRWRLGKSDRSIESGASKKNGKKATPSYGLIDSQSVRISGASEGRGFDGGKKTKGCKRHIVVDTMGNPVQVIVHAANVHDTRAGCDVLRSTAEKYPTIKAFSGDTGYRGTAVEFVENTLQLKLHISKKSKTPLLFCQCGR